jgi:hypothetical protein
MNRTAAETIRRRRLPGHDVGVGVDDLVTVGHGTSSIPRPSYEWPAGPVAQGW